MSRWRTHRRRLPPDFLPGGRAAFISRVRLLPGIRRKEFTRLTRIDWDGGGRSALLHQHLLGEQPVLHASPFLPTIFDIEFVCPGGNLIVSRF